MTHCRQMPEWEQLLRACLAEDADEIREFATLWSETVNPHDMDYRCMRLIPFFVDHLNAYGVDVPHAKRLTVIYKFWWLKSQWILHELEKITNLFHDRSIPLMVTKGVALYQVYDKPLHRTMVDIDVIVPQEKVVQAFDLLEENGFVGEKLTYDMYKRFPKLTRSQDHAFYLVNTISGLQIDLHWTVGNRMADRVMDHAWKESRPDPVNDTRRLPPKHLLFVMNAINGFMSQNHHGNWLLDAKRMLDAFSDDEIQTLDSYLADNPIPIWPHVLRRLNDFGIACNSACADVDDEDFVVPTIGAVRERPTIFGKLKTIIDNYRSLYQLYRLVGNAPSRLVYTCRYIQWTLVMIAVLSTHPTEDLIKQKQKTL